MQSFIYVTPAGKITISTENYADFRTEQAEQSNAQRRNTVSVAQILEAVCGVHFGTQPRGELKETPLIRKTYEQLCEYFDGKRKTFDLPLKIEGTPFQKKVWQALTEIPYGETRTYKEIACAVGNEKACRAVGLANNKNPIGIIVPCHRVVGSNGKLKGYAGGLEAKQFLLDLEGLTNRRCSSFASER